DRSATDALVLGAGGSSRAVLFGLLERGIGRIHLANRTRARAGGLAEKFGARVRPIDWSEGTTGARGTKLPVDTPAPGMKGGPPVVFDVGVLPPDAVVADNVSVPLHTPLLLAGRARGLRTADGLGMLLHQAVGGFALWFGQRPSVTTELRALVEADLAK